ncbi:MAG: hypothetical protein VX727_01930 [Planctomycetota bacterium]|nr:hypothetical protein [Planctomycetota bacterium]|tara:strand:+ start:7800 stop:8243 length:444 start_codon:yes stop_codon:yes gene_type:complete
MTTPNEDILEWSVHPLRERPGRAVGTCLIILACGLLVAVAVGDPTGGVLAGGAAILFLILMLNRFFLPSYYRMDGVGIAVRHPIGTRSLRWVDLRRFPHNESGGYLSTRERGGMFDSRGISVLFAGRGDEIVPWIKSAMDRSREAGE